MMLALAVPSMGAARVDAELEYRLTTAINSGDFQLARDLLLAVPHSDAERFLLDGRILKAQGRYDDAVAYLRNAVQAAPDDLRSRRELAHALFLAKRYGPAKYHLEILLIRDSDPRLRSGYRRFLQQIDQQRPVTLSGFLEFKPSTNINSGSTEQYLRNLLVNAEIDEDSRAKSGVGIHAGGSALYRKHISARQRVELKFDIEHTRYSQDDSLDATSAGLELRNILRRSNAQMTLAPFARRIWTNNSNDQRILGLRFQQNVGVTPRSNLSFWMSHAHHLFLDLDTSSGWRSSAGIGYARQITPSISWGTSLSVQASRPELDHNRYNGLSLSGRMSKDWQGGTITQASIFGGYRDFQGDAPLGNLRSL